MEIATERKQTATPTPRTRWPVEEDTGGGQHLVLVPTKVHRWNGLELQPRLMYGVRRAVVSYELDLEPCINGLQADSGIALPFIVAS